MTSELAMKSKEIESQVANHIRNLQMELESYQQRLKEEQDIARRATAQGDRSENAEWQIATTPSCVSMSLSCPSLIRLPHTRSSPHPTSLQGRSW